jgi:hypothetical protein
MEKSFKVTEENAKNAPVKDIQWEGQQMETEGKPLMDDGKGQPIILRTFDFHLPPLKETPSKEELLKFHKSKITAFLWRDELIPVQEFKLSFSKNCNCCQQEKRHFRIFALCQAKLGSTILERPQLLQEYASNKRT